MEKVTLEDVEFMLGQLEFPPERALERNFVQSSWYSADSSWHSESNIPYYEQDGGYWDDEVAFGVRVSDDMGDSETYFYPDKESAETAFQKYNAAYEKITAALDDITEDLPRDFWDILETKEKEEVLLKYFNQGEI